MMKGDPVADVEAEMDDFDEFDDFSLGDEEAAQRRAENDAKTHEFRVIVVRAMGDLIRQVQELAALQETTIKALGNLAKAQAEGQRAQFGVAQALDRLSMSFAREQGETRTILSAPRELVRDADGKPVGVKIKNGA